MGQQFAVGLAPRSALGGGDGAAAVHHAGPAAHGPGVGDDRAQVVGLELECGVADAGGQLAVDRAAHGRVQQGGGDAAVHHADRVVERLARRKREGRDAPLHRDEAHSQQPGDGRRRQLSLDDGLQELQAAGLAPALGQCGGVVPGDDAATGRRRGDAPAAVPSTAGPGARSRATAGVVEGSAPGSRALTRPSPMAVRAAATPPATMSPYAPWKVASASAGDGVPTTATSTDTPSTAPIWRAQATTALPVANRAGGSSATAALLSDEKLKPTPAPVSTVAGRNSPT